MGTTDPFSHSPPSGMPERETSPPPSPSTATPVNLSEEALCLQMEMNNTMIYLLSVKATLEACHQQLISEVDVNQCQNDIDTSEAIREVKARYTITDADVEASMKRMEVNCLASLNEVKAYHIAGIWKAKAANAASASKLHQQHQWAMQCLGEDDLEVEKQAQQSFLQAHGLVLQACPNKAMA